MNTAAKFALYQAYERETHYMHLVVLIASFYNLTGGTIILFDRKMLRNFRKDGHSWKKKKDGKTVKEAHEHLKVRVSFKKFIRNILGCYFRLCLCLK